MRQRLLVSAVLLAIFYASSWALFHPHFFRTHDYIHGARIIEMTRGLSDGQFPVRWSQNFAYGYGMPLFQFYAPLPYYIGAGFYFLGVPFLMSVKLLFFLATGFAVIGAYILGKEIAGRTGGVVLAATYVMAPYRALNLFVRGAISESWGMAALPFIFLGVLRILRGKRWGELLLVVSLSALFLSHNLTTLITLFFLIIFVGLYGIRSLVVIHFSKNKGKNKKLKELANQLLAIAGSGALAVAISAFYLFPAFLEKDSTQIRSATLGGYFDYKLHFLYARQYLHDDWGYGASILGFEDDISFFLGYGQLVGAGLAGVGLLLAIAWVVRKYSAKEWIKTLILSDYISMSLIMFTLLAVSLFLGIFKAQPVWDALSPVLAFIQFPWRLLAVSTLFLSIVCAFFVKNLPRPLRLVFASLVVILSVGFNYNYFKPQWFWEDVSEFYYREPHLIRAKMSGVLPDFIPINLSKNLPVSDSIVPSTVSAQLAVIEESSDSVLLQALVQEETFIPLNIAYFPGWKATANGQEVEVEETESGTMRVLVPAGESTIHIWFGDTPLRAMADGVSALGVIGLVGYGAYEWRKKK